MIGFYTEMLEEKWWCSVYSERHCWCIIDAMS